MVVAIPWAAAGPVVPAAAGVVVAISVTVAKAVAVGSADSPCPAKVHTDRVLLFFGEGSD